VADLKILWNKFQDLVDEYRYLFSVYGTQCTNYGPTVGLKEKLVHEI